LLVVGLSRVGLVFVLSIIDETLLDLPLFLRSFAQLESALLVLDSGYFDFSMSAHSHVRFGSMMSLLGMARFDYAFSLSIQEFVFLASSFLLRSFARSGSSLLASDHTSSGSLILLRNSCYVDSFLSLCGMGCLSSSPSIFGQAHFDFLLFPRSSSHLAFAIFAFGFATLGSLLFLRQFTRPGFLPFVPGSTRAASVFFLSVVDSSYLGPSMLTQQSARLDPVLSVSDFLHLGLPSSAQQPMRTGPIVPTVGLSRADSVFFLPVTDGSHLGLFLLTRSLSRLDSFSFALQFASVGFPLSLRSSCHLGFLALVCGKSSPDFLLPILSHVHPESSPSLHSSSYPALVLSVSDFQHMGFPVSPRDLFRVGLLLPIFGLSCVGFVFSPFIIDDTLLDLSLPAHSFSRFGFVPSVLDFFRPGLPLFVRQHACVDSVVLALGLACAESVSSLSVFAETHLDSFLLPRSFACLDSVLLVCDASHMASPLLLRSPGQPDPAPLILGIARLGLLSLTFEHATMDFLTFPRSFACLGSLPLASDCSHVDFSTFPHSFSKLGLLLFALGLVRAAFVFFLSVSDVSTLGSLMFLHGYA